MYYIVFWSHVTVVQGGVYAHMPRVGEMYYVLYLLYLAKGVEA